MGRIERWVADSGKIKTGAMRAGGGFSTVIRRACGVFLLCAAVWAQEKPVAPAGRLDAFAPLVGRDWTAPLPTGNLTDTQHFEWMYGRRFIRNTHQVKTAKGEVVYEGETLYAWDARAGRIVWWYWNASGGYLEGTASIGADGTINIEGQNHGDAGQLDRIRSTIRIAGDSWTFDPSSEKGGVWKSEATRTYR